VVVDVADEVDGLGIGDDGEAVHKEWKLWLTAWE